MFEKQRTTETRRVRFRVEAGIDHGLGEAFKNAMYSSIVTNSLPCKILTFVTNLLLATLKDDEVGLNESCR